MKEESAKEIYSALNKVWPENNYWYDYTLERIVSFIVQNFSQMLDCESIYLNAGSGGTTYDIPGCCYHIDIAPNLLKGLTHAYIASVEKTPFASGYFDAAICVGSVLNYCDAYSAITELSRVIKPNGLLILEFERSNTAELWFSKEYGKSSTIQKYEYLNHLHTLWLYSEKYIKNILKNSSFKVIEYKRFHNLSAIINKITKNENFAGRFSKYDSFFKPFSYLMAHDIILLCQKI